MVATIEQLDKQQAVLEVQQKTLETEQRTLAQGHADLRERQTRVLEQLAFIRVEISAVKTFFTWFVSLIVAIGILMIGLLNYLK